MVLRTYRFRAGTEEALAALSRKVGSAVTLSAKTGAKVIDLICDDAAALSLQDVLFEAGYEFISTDPVTPPIADFIPDTVTPPRHKALRDLIHFIDEGGPADGFASGAVEQVLTPGPFPTGTIWWTNAGMTERIVDQTVVYNPNRTIATSVWRMYDTDGTTVLVTLTDTFAYTGLFATARTRTWV